MPGSAEPPGCDPRWTKPTIKTFSSLAELKLELPHIYEELTKRGVIKEGEIVWPKDEPPQDGTRP